MDKRMTILNHFNVLRKMLVRVLIIVFIFSVVMYFFSPHIVLFLKKPVDSLIFISPAEAFMVKIKVSLLSGIIVSFPLIILLVYKFFSCALFLNEKKSFLITVPVLIINFYIGIIFGWKVVLPMALNFLLNITFAGVNPMISFKLYISFITLLLIAFGCAFEFPVILFILAKLKIINPKSVSAKRGYIYVAIFIISALITPPDIISQVLLAGPLIIMFEISTLFGKMAYKR